MKPFAERSTRSLEAPGSEVIPAGALETRPLVRIEPSRSWATATGSLARRLAKPLLKGKTAVFFGVGTIGGGLLLPLLARLAWKLTKKPTPRGLNIGASLLVLAGGLILRYVWVVVGRASADDPQATHRYNAMEWSESRRRV